MYCSTIHNRMQSPFTLAKCIPKNTVTTAHRRNFVWSKNGNPGVHVGTMSEQDKPISRNRLTNKQTTAPYLSGNSTPNSFRSDSSQTPLTMDIPELLVPPASDNTEHGGDEEDTTYFLLDIQTPDDELEQERYSRSSSPSSSSSESAQIVIDSGILRPSQYDHGSLEDGRPHQLTESPRREDIHPMEVSSMTPNGHSSGKEGNRIMTIYTEEEDDLMDEMPRWNQEVMHRRHSLLEEDSHAESDWAADKNGLHNRRDRQNSYISSTRRESSFSRNPGLSSEEALRFDSSPAPLFVLYLFLLLTWGIRRLLEVANSILEEERVKTSKDIRKYPFTICI
jgi:hypothetical protein